MEIDSKWRGKYKNARDYWIKIYDKKFYSFDALQTTVDPDETIDDLNNLTSDQQADEIIKCRESFAYFCQKFIKILHPTEGLVRFILYNYQKQCISDFDNHRFNIISKFRQGGLTTVSVIYALWLCLFNLDQQILFISKTDREAVASGMMLDRIVENMPKWLINRDDARWNDHFKAIQSTGSFLRFHSPEASRGKSCNLLLVDEAAFVDNMETHWAAIYPVLSSGGRAVVISTTNGVGNWYEQTYHDAQIGKNRFHVIDIDYYEHPQYCKPGWAEEMRAQLGERKFQQEIMRSFLGSGETYISATKLTELEQKVKNYFPIKKLLPEWNNLVDDTNLHSEFNKGALWIWKQPIEGREYIIGIDAAEGVGSEGDNSCMQIIDQNTMEQVAEFYSNIIPPHEFAQICYEIGVFYNNAMLVVEDMAAGAVVLNCLINNLYYDNLYVENRTNKSKPGLKVTISNRTLILQALQTKISTSELKINSHRLLREFRSFEYNSSTKKAQAAKGKHDDAILAIAFVCYARDEVVRDIPLGMDSRKVQGAISTTVQEFRNELRSSFDNLDYMILKESKDEFSTGLSDEDQFYLLNKYRKKHSLLKEFGF